MMFAGPSVVSAHPKSRITTMAEKSRKPEPLLRTPDEELGKVEHFKLNSNMARNDLHKQFRDADADSIEEEAEQIAKSHGIYLEYNRAKTGREKDWMYMLRITVPGGGPFNATQWQILDDLTEQVTAGPDVNPSMKLTTRQNIQFHWIKKPDVIHTIQTIAKTGYYTLNGCGDNARNVMGCPLSRHSDIYNAHAKAQYFGEYFRLPGEPHIEVFEIDTSAAPRTPDEHYQYGPKLMNRKFKIAFSAVHRNEVTGELEKDNCVEVRTNDVGIVPVLEGDGVTAYQVFIGGGQGEKNGKPTFATLAKPVGIFTEENLKDGLDAIAKVHEQWGDRKNRHWARLKYVVHEQGIPWYQDRIRELGATFDEPDPAVEPGPRKLHFGWHTQPDNGKLARGVYIESGRVINRRPGSNSPGDRVAEAAPNEQLKSMVRHLMDNFDCEAMITPNQDLLFTNIDPAAKEDFDAAMEKFNYREPSKGAVSRLRQLSGACVGLNTCRLSYTESEQFEFELMHELEKRGYGEMNESIGITGCERQCFRAGTKTIGWVGQGPNMYALKVGGSEDGRYQGTWLVGEDEEGEQKMYLRQCPRDRVADVTQVLFDAYLANRQSEREDMGAYCRRLGAQGIIELLKTHDKTGDLMQKTAKAPYLENGAVPVNADA
jgi:sulfite reductase (NADPH) hemoprotein beta-component